jgi:hypothetical protein
VPTYYYKHNHIEILDVKNISPGVVIREDKRHRVQLPPSQNALMKDNQYGNYSRDNMRLS